MEKPRLGRGAMDNSNADHNNHSGYLDTMGMGDSNDYESVIVRRV